MVAGPSRIGVPLIIREWLTEESHDSHQNYGGLFNRRRQFGIIGIIDYYNSARNQKDSIDWLVQ